MTFYIRVEKNLTVFEEFRPGYLTTPSTELVFLSNTFHPTSALLSFWPNFVWNIGYCIFKKIELAQFLYIEGWGPQKDKVKLMW